MMVNALRGNSVDQTGIMGQADANGKPASGKDLTPFRRARRL